MENVKTQKSAILLALICTIFISIGQLFFKIGSAKIISNNCFGSSPYEYWLNAFISANYKNKNLY